MPDSARKLATYADLLAIPDDTRAEILAGEIVDPFATGLTQPDGPRTLHAQLAVPGLLRSRPA